MLKNVAIRWKLTLSTLAFLACIIALGYSYLSKVGEQVAFTEQEERGNAYQRAVMPVLLRVSLLKHSHQLGRDAASLVEAIDTSFAKIDAAQSTHGEALQFTEAGLKSRDRAHLAPEAVKAKWESVKAGLNKPYDAASYTGLLADVRGMIAHLGDTSNLVLDPDLDSYYLMDVTLLALPQAIDRLGQLGVRLSALEELSSEETLELAVISRLVKESDHDRIVADMDTVLKEDGNFYGPMPSLQAEALPKLDVYKAAVEQVVGNLNAALQAGDVAAAKATVGDVLKAQLAASELWDASIGSLDGMLAARLAAIHATSNQTLMIQVVALLASLAFFIFIVRSITGPLARIRVQMLELAEGKIQDSIAHTDRGDEIGAMAGSLGVFQEGLIAKNQMEAEQKEADARAVAERKRMIEEIALNFEMTVKGSVDVVASAATQMDATAQSMESNIAQSTEKLQNLIEGIQAISGQVEAVSSSTGQLSLAINEITGQVTRASTVAKDSAVQGKKTTQSVVELEQSAQAIQQVVDLINTITGQINLLALNATIEAARAGEAGKGFAVVASEVKALADQTGKATEQIVTQINTMQTAIGQSSGLVRSMVVSIDQVNEASTVIAAAVEEQGAATKEIASSSERSKSATGDVAESAKSMTSAVQQSRVSANEMRMAAQELSRQAESLRGQVQSFLVQMRSA